MTIKELLEYLKHIKRVVPEVLIAENRKLSHNEICDVIEDIISKVKQLEDKETPKKVKGAKHHYFFGTYDWNHTSGYCPNCNKDVNCDEYYQPKYCSVCGQRLDWNLEKENDNK